MNNNDRWIQLRAKDPEPDGPHGFIQWKGTDVCADLYCECGHHGHFDGYFFYHYKCPECGAKYTLGHWLKLIPLSEDEAKYVEAEHCGFRTSDD